jgi:hypothetical protein
VVREHDLLELLDHHGGATQSRDATPPSTTFSRCGDDQQPVVGDQPDRTPIGGLAVRLVDDDQAVGRFKERLDRGLGLDRASRVVGAAQEHERGPVLGEERAGGRGVDREVGRALPYDHRGPGDASDVRVQGVRGLEHRRRPPGTAECELRRLQHRVRAVGRTAARRLVGCSASPERKSRARSG